MSSAFCSPVGLMPPSLGVPPNLAPLAPADGAHFLGIKHHLGWFEVLIWLKPRSVLCVTSVGFGGRTVITERGRRSFGSGGPFSVWDQHDGRAFAWNAAIIAVDMRADQAGVPRDTRPPASLLPA
jgi:hypothetical protein